MLEVFYIARGTAFDIAPILLANINFGPNSLNISYIIIFEYILIIK